MVRLVWEGFYLDGKIADKKPASVELTPESLRIRVSNGESLVWPYHEIRQVQGLYAGDPVRLEHGDTIPESLIIDDSDFLVSLHSLAPQKTGHFHNPANRSLRTRLTVYAGLGILAAGVLLYFWGIPMLAAVATPMIPVEWEKGIGKSVLEALAPEEKQCKDPELNKALNDITAMLAAHDHSGYSFRVYVVDSNQVNALALPGGSIIIFRGLIEKTESPDEIAGVLAHEMQHITRRHATKRIIEDSSTGLMISAVTGDLTGAMMYTVKIANMLAQLSYSRSDEDEADEEGMKMVLASGIDPSGMIRLFETIKEQNTIPGFLQYVSTHPDMNKRIERLRKLSEEGSAQTHRKLPGAGSWSRLKQNCTDA